MRGLGSAPTRQRLSPTAKVASPRRGGNSILDQLRRGRGPANCAPLSRQRGARETRADRRGNAAVMEIEGASLGSGDSTAAGARCSVSFSTEKRVQEPCYREVENSEPKVGDQLEKAAPSPGDRGLDASKKVCRGKQEPKTGPESPRDSTGTSTPVAPGTSSRLGNTR